MTNSGMQSTDEICVICGTFVTCGIKSILNTQNANKTKLDEKVDQNLPSPHTRNLPLPDVALGTKSSSIKYIFLLVSQYNKAVHAFGNTSTACEFPEFCNAVPSKLRITHSVICVIILQYECH